VLCLSRYKSISVDWHRGMMLPKFNNIEVLRLYSKQKITGTYCKTVARKQSFNMSNEREETIVEQHN